ncbi:hypothetical protein Tco_1054988 [Tanacetum coccineum]|uniref:Uncharacterized protein n=1 Tax=Tanacetum coccineum TaxID=301880 RepID=A0ABQ5GYD0_9ASTR
MSKTDGCVLSEFVLERGVGRNDIVLDKGMGSGLGCVDAECVLFVGVVLNVDVNIVVGFLGGDIGTHGLSTYDMPCGVWIVRSSWYLHVLSVCGQECEAVVISGVTLVVNVIGGGQYADLGT